jgi:hypothetical protein
VHCPRCGAPSEEGAKYCAACGATLPGAGPEPPERTPFRERIRRLVGTTRRAQWLTAATVLAIAIAIAAFIVLPTNDDSGTPQDAYTRAADATCVKEKQQIAAAQQRALQGGAEGLSRYADDLVLIAADWRSTLAGTSPPPDRVDQAQELQAALLEVEARAGTLARVAREGSRKAILAQASRVDASTARVESAVDGLGLERCADVSLGLGRVDAG